MKRKLTLFLALVMVASLLAGCANNETASNFYDPTIKVGDTGGLELPLTDKNMSIEWQVVSSENNLNESWFMEKLRGVTGVDVKLNVTPASTVNEKLQALIAGGNMPDIIGRTADMEEMEQTLIELGYTDIAKDVRRLIEYCEERLDGIQIEKTDSISLNETVLFDVYCPILK